MGRAHISPCRRTRPRRDACRRRPKGPWSRSQNLADCIIATSAARPERARWTLDSTLTSDYVSAWRARACAPRGFEAIGVVTAHPGVDDVPKPLASVDPILANDTGTPLTDEGATVSNSAVSPDGQM